MYHELNPESSKIFCSFDFRPILTAHSERGRHHVISIGQNWKFLGYRRRKRGRTRMFPPGPWHPRCTLHAGRSPKSRVVKLFRMRTGSAARNNYCATMQNLPRRSKDGDRGPREGVPSDRQNPISVQGPQIQDLGPSQATLEGCRPGHFGRYR